MSVRNRLPELAQGERWLELLSHTVALAPADSLDAGLHFFHGLALLHTGNAVDARAAGERGLQLDSESGWGNKLVFDARLATGDTALAFSDFAAFINCGSRREDEKAWYVERAAALSLFDLAVAMNESRFVIETARDHPTRAICLQTFCKADTLERVIDSLLQVQVVRPISLVILQDSEVGSSDPDRYHSGRVAATEVVTRRLAQLMGKFYSVELILNEINLGTAPGCRKLLDIAGANVEQLLFIEDDCVLSPGGPEWAFKQVEKHVSIDSNWFITCESSFFDTGELDVDASLHSRLERLAAHPDIRDAIVYQDFVPSTCFATTAEVWRKCRTVRSLTRGPESLSSYCREAGKRTLAPVVPRAADIGMLHPLGYSYSKFGQNVGEKKNTILLSPQLDAGGDTREYAEDRDLLFSATSKADPRAVEILERRLGLLPTFDVPFKAWDQDGGAATGHRDPQE